MEEVLLTRLKRLANQIETLSNQATELDSLSIDLRYNAEVIKTKLEALLTRLGNDLNNYFKTISVPASDEINIISEIQLKAEENLAEITVKLKLLRDNAVNPSTSRVTETTTSCRLPKLSLPEFGGDILNWHQFWDQFQSNIHERNISDVDKLLYLKSSLKGEAKQTIDGFDTTNKNYNIAVETLKNRYGKSSHLIDAHYSALSRVTTSDATITSCRKTFNELERHLRVLESLGEDVNHNHLRHLIFSKFTEDLIYELKLKLRDDSIHTIRKELENIITAREDANRISRGNNAEENGNYTTETLHVIHGDQKSQPQWRSKRRDRNIPTRKTEDRKRRFPPSQNRMEKFRGDRNIENNTYGKRMKMTCLFCNEVHFSDVCDKYKTLKERKLQLRDRCYGCFQRGHRIAQCRYIGTCYHCKKHEDHNRALCPKKFQHNPVTTTLCTMDGRGHTILQTAIATTRGNQNNAIQTQCRILFDSGSQRSYVTKTIARELNLPIEKRENLTVYTFGTRSPQEFESPVVQLELETKSKKRKIIYANIVPMISQGVPYVKKFLDWNSKVELADDGSLVDRVDILIGNDYYYSFLRSEKIQVSEDLYLIDSEFGWVLSGRIDTQDKEKEHMSVVTYFQTELDFKLNKPDMPLDQGSITFLWELESIGITDSPKITRDEEAVHKFNETTRLIGNRYFVSWPWREYPPSLTPNYGLAYGRLVNLVKRLDKETLKAYNKAIQEQISNGVVEEISDKTQRDHPVHYLPHHCVVQRDKPIRIVYDASSKIKGHKSLNECLYCGPLMLEDLTCILIRFRSHNIALSADVEKAFLQIGLHEQDRDVTRFIWLKDINKPPSEENIVCLRFCRVPFGVISSPFILNATVKHHLSKGSERLHSIAKDIYVDNLVTGVHTQEEAVQLYHDTKHAFQQISMNLRDWSSNSKHFLNKIPDVVGKGVVKVLGLDWYLEQDSLHLRFNLNTEANSKREVLKVIASVYDPCGFVVPYVLAAKLFLQELWQTKLKWDTVLSKELKVKWSKIREELHAIREVSIPRCYMENVRKENYHLHCFTDASLKAYAAVVYVTHGSKRRFVIGKTRLVPIKDQQHLRIPRLELLAVIIGCRLMRTVLKALHVRVERQTLWTDSQVVLEWCKSDKLLPPFVARRIEEIRSNKELLIKYVPSELNPADIATRPACSNEDKERWLRGPEYLSESSRQSFPVASTTLSFLFATPNASNENNGNLEPVNNLLKEDISTNEDDNASHDGPLSTIEEIRKLQAENFAREVAEKETDLSRNLKLFKDVDGLLRCRGRLQNSDLSFDKRYPILIPKDCHFTNKLIEKTHNDNYHVGANHTLSLIRHSYWIPNGKSQIQRILRRCPRCIKHGAGPFKLPPTPALPTERANYSEPFTFVGVDYMGPVLVKNDQKRWICLFTCLAVRAVHLELVENLSAEEGLLALRRTIATRRIPQIITSDNATHFKLISEILSKQYCIDNKIQWKFIPQLAPWFGGFYERLIGIIKNCMKRTLAKHMLSNSQLTTVVKEIEAVLNSRPLTCVDAELDIILKPADFLTPGKCINIEEPVETCLENGSVLKVDLIKSWRRGLTILKEFKDMFINRYLLSLRERYHHSHKEPRVTSKLAPAIGQIVQIKGGNKNRETWKVGKITALKGGSDDLCRVAVVKVGDKDFTRSIAHLYPLEVQETEEVTDERSGGENTPSKQVPMNTSEPLCENRDKRRVINDEKEQTNSSPTLISDPVQDDIDHEIPDHDMGDSNSDTDDSKRSETLERTGTGEGDKTETRVRRTAATEALKKIREWTCNLLCLF